MTMLNLMLQRFAAAQSCSLKQLPLLKAGLINPKAAQRGMLAVGATKTCTTLVASHTFTQNFVIIQSQKTNRPIDQ